MQVATARKEAPETGGAADVRWPEELLKSVTFPRITLYEMLSRSVARYSERPVLCFLNMFMSYRELLDAVDRLAAALNDLGLRKGDVAAFVMPSCFQYVVAYYACAKIGVIVTGINPTYKPGEALHQLKITGANTLIVLDALYEPLIAPVMAESAIDRIIVTNLVDLVKIPAGLKAKMKESGQVPTGNVPAGAFAFNDLLASEAAPVTVDLSTDDVATYIMTGGTTGVPKAAVLTHHNCVSFADTGGLSIIGESGECIIGILPLFHVFGMGVMHCIVRCGGFQLLFPRPPETEEMLKIVCAVAPDGKAIYPGTEILFQRLADDPAVGKYPLAKKLKGCLCSAGPLHKNVKERFARNIPGVPLVEAYGLSEASAGVSFVPFDKTWETGSIGMPLPGLAWKIVDMETGTREMPPGENGELIVSGPTVMKEYLNNPAETAETIRTSADGARWLFTGDIGYMDAYGRVYLNDRKKQLIKIKGYSVFPTEVEDLLGRHEAVFESVVAGLPDPDAGEAIKAWIVLKEGRQGRVTAEEILAWCKQNMTHYKVPRHIEFITAVPKSIVGKVLRRELQEADPLYRANKA